MNIKYAELKIAGMQSRDCEQSIENAISLLPGINKVKADYAKKNLIIQYDYGVVGEKDFQQVLENKGYEIRQEEVEKKSTLFGPIALLALLTFIGFMIASQGGKLTESGYDFNSVKESVKETIDSVDLDDGK